jgi:hypothetical protein
MKRGIVLEIEESEYRRWKKRIKELEYLSIEKYLLDLVEQDIEHDFCENKLLLEEDEGQGIHN